MNKYSRKAPLMITSGQFWRCRHDYTLLLPCWKCGILHPIRLIVNTYYYITYLNDVKVEKEKEYSNK